MPRNNITLKQLRAFVVVADKGSFVAGAEVLALSQPALSQSIRQLEDQIGTALFHRTTRSVKLTSIGMAFLTTARNLIHEFDAGIAEIQDAAARAHGRVVVSCLPSIAYRIMPRVIAASEQARPGMRVIIRDVNQKSIISAVTSGDADIGIGSFATLGPSIDGMIIAHDRFFAALPRAHPLARRRELRWRDLEGCPFIAMTRDNGIRGIVDDALAQQDVRLAIASEVSNLATVLGLLEEGFGITALPRLALPPDNHPGLVCRPLSEPKVERTIRVIWRHGIGLAPAALALIGTIRAVLSSGPVAEEGMRVEGADAWAEEREQPAALRH